MLPFHGEFDGEVEYIAVDTWAYETYCGVRQAQFTIDGVRIYIVA